MERLLSFWIAQSISSGLAASRNDARTAIRAFFISPSAKRLKYISELLDGTFTFFALSVSDSTAEYFEGTSPSPEAVLKYQRRVGRPRTARQPAAGSRRRTSRNHQVRELSVQPHYHERTLKEILEILDAARSSLKKQHFTPSLSQAYLQYFASRGGGFGLERQFHALNANREMDTEAFLARFDHVEDLLRDRGIQRYNQQGAEEKRRARAN